MALVDAVVRWLVRNPHWLERPAAQPHGMHAAVSKEGMLWIGPPPTRSNMPPPPELEQMSALAAKFEVAGRDTRNRRLGRAGEERVLLHERANLSAHGRRDLASKVRWVAEEEGDGAGFDIASFEPDGQAARPAPRDRSGAYGTELPPDGMVANVSPRPSPH